MYLHIGQGSVVLENEIIGIFDMDNTTVSRHTRGLLQRIQREGEVVMVADDVPKSFLLCQTAGRPETVYLAQLSPATLQKRLSKRQEDLYEY